MESRSCTTDVERAHGADGAAQAVGFGPDEASACLIAANELARTHGRNLAAFAGVAPPARHAVAADKAPPTISLLQLLAEVLVLVFGRLDAISLASVAATCSELYRGKSRPMTLEEEALRQRAAAHSRVCPDRLPPGVSSWAAHLAWLAQRRDESWAPVAASSTCSFFVAEGVRLMSCGVEEEDEPGGCSALASSMMWL